MSRHVGPIYDGEWWACDHPEREITEWTVFMVDCEPCRIALDALAVRDPLMCVDVHNDGVVGEQRAIEYFRGAA